MYEYFPGNYTWNLSVVAVLNSGGTIDEVDRACRPLREAARRGEDAGTEDFLAAWTAVADNLVELAELDEAAGRHFSAAAKYHRAGSYLILAERMQAPGSPGRLAVYQRAVGLHHRAIKLGGEDIEIVEIPYGDSTLPAYYMPARTADGSPAPCVIQCNGLDSFKESMLFSGFPQAMARRGVATLMVDQPGTGGALRLNGLTATVRAEDWAAACVDHLQTRQDVDADRIGIVGWSLGGYYAPRAAAFEKRLKLCVAWGANHDWGEMQRRRLEREGERPVPHYWDHVMWVWGHEDLSEFMKAVEEVTLDGVVEKITVPFLITHGVNDRQIPVEYAHRSYEQAVNSPKRELKIYTEREGGVEHVHLDGPHNATDFIADWVAETFGSPTRPA
ncbi:alpha/beta hydrolase family protein [Streptomyces sp. NPDC002643]